jgi:SecD/SecF fusion protein
LTPRRNNILLVGAIAAAIVGALLLIVPGSPFHKKPTLGLDLQGGFAVVLQADPPPERQLTEADLDRSVEIIRERIDKLGVTEPEVRKQGTDQISVELPGVEDQERVSRLIGSTAQLELYDMTPALTGASIDAQGFQAIPNETLFDLLGSSRTRSLVSRNADDAGPYYLFRAQSKRLLAGPFPTERALRTSDAARAAGVTADSLPKTLRIFAQPADTVLITCDDSASVCPGVGRETLPGDNFVYLFKHDPDAKDIEDRFPQMAGGDLELDGTRQDFDTQSGQPIVTMQFTDAGADKFHDITREEADRGRFLYNRLGQGADPEAFNQSFAIVLDREIKSFPSIDFEQYPDGISGSNGAQITGLDSLQEAKDLALVLQTGALPVEFVTLESSRISATLGDDSLRQALRAAIGGLILVALFLLIVYRFLGVVAVFGLAIYALLTYTVILIFNVTLTLPGFAGMILAIGVAADANIVIFERIKEESAAGKSVKAAVSSGYSKGLATIIDANVVTAITALILFAVATGGVRGFAFLLLLGTVISIATAVFATRAMLGLLGGFAWFDNPRFMGASAQHIAKWQRFDAVGRRRLWFSLSGIAIALSILSIAVNGLNLGIDFRGGSQLTFTTPQPVQVADVRAEAERLERAKATIQGKGEEAADGGFREFQIKTEPLGPEELNRLTAALERRFDAESEGARNVSASFSEQILRGAIYAIVFSFLLITLYITFRFQWRFALPILRTIVNDGLIALGIYSLSGREVSAGTVAAFLTIIGYSIYDTIIIFDRVRENLPLMRRSTVAEIVNTSLWETIRRSLATTFITLLPVSALLFFGGDTLKDFAFAIMIGISISAFSTIFIAAPFLAVLLERQPEYARKKAADAPAGGEPLPADAGAGAGAVEEPEAEPAIARVPADGALAPIETDAEKRERRRQRRRARPHGRAR